MGHKERTKPTMDGASVLRGCFKYRRNLKHLHGTFKHAEHSHVINYQGINSGGKAWKSIRCEGVRVRERHVFTCSNKQ